MIHKRTAAFERSVKIFYRFHGFHSPNLTLSLDVDQDT